MKTATERYCAICLEPREESRGWFLLTENRWTDRLKILAWNEWLAVQPGVHAACGAEHVRQLVIHWMAMGTLEYPFARTRRRNKGAIQKGAVTEPQPEPDTHGMKMCGELSVHRESLERVLAENPQSLATILMALVAALGGHAAPVQAEETENEPIYELT